MTITLHAKGLSDPAFAGIINLDNFSPEELIKLRLIHKQVLRDRALKDHECIEKIIQDNLVLKRLLLALRNLTEATSQNESLLKQIDERLRV